LRHGPSGIDDVVAGLRRRWARLLADPDRSSLATRAERVFDGPDGWPLSVFHTPDVQIAAASVDAINDGDFLCVIGDYHPGGNALGQGVFAHRHPDRDRFLAQIRHDAGPFPFLVPTSDTPQLSGRVMPAITRPDDVHVTALTDSVAPLGHRSVSIADLALDGRDLTDRNGTIRFPIEDLLQSVLLIAGIHAYDPFPVEDHGDRVTISRTVLRRETWHIAAGDIPHERADLTAWARSMGLPRRAFAHMPTEAKPFYVDFDSDALTRILRRHTRRLRDERPDGRVRFTEMVPSPDQCWFTDDDGRRYTSELRVVAVDRQRHGRT
jgi:hypothetical protein